jgi:F-type H+-transporting ATPase subunit delta
MAERLTIARPYAKAVFQLAREQQQLPAWSSILQRGASAVQDARVAPLLGSPHATPNQLAELIAGIAGDGSGAAGAAPKGAAAKGSADKGDSSLAALARSLFATLATYRRLAFLPEIAAQFEQLRADAERTLDVTVTSAVALNEAQREQFTRALRKRLDREVRLHCELDPSLIGGAVVRADDLVIDGSVRSSLNQLAAVAAS